MGFSLRLSAMVSGLSTSNHFRADPLLRVPLLGHGDFLAHPLCGYPGSVRTSGFKTPTIYSKNKTPQKGHFIFWVASGIVRLRLTNVRLSRNHPKGSRLRLVICIAAPHSVRLSLSNPPRLLILLATKLPISWEVWWLVGFEPTTS